MVQAAVCQALLPSFGELTVMGSCTVSVDGL